MEIITEETITTMYSNSLNHAKLHTPINLWVTKPTELLMTEVKSAYGLADRKGRIFINKAFINTTASKFLNHVILHELSHLIVGLHHKHDRYFKSVLKQLDPKNENFSEERIQVSKNIKKKYQLIAIIKGGLKVNISKRDRKHKKYTEYHKYHSKDLYAYGFLVERFEYDVLL